MKPTRKTILPHIKSILNKHDDKTYFKRCKEAVQFFDSIAVDKKYDSFLAAAVYLNGFYYTKNGTKRYKKIKCLCTTIYFDPSLNVIQFNFRPFRYNEGITGSIGLGSDKRKSF